MSHEIGRRFPKPTKTHCKAGHAMTEDNCQLKIDCRTCQRARVEKCRAKKDGLGRVPQRP